VTEIEGKTELNLRTVVLDINTSMAPLFHPFILYKYKFAQDCIVVEMYVSICSLFTNFMGHDLILLYSYNVNLIFIFVRVV